MRRRGARLLAPQGATMITDAMKKVAVLKPHRGTSVPSSKTWDQATKTKRGLGDGSGKSTSSNITGSN